MDKCEAAMRYMESIEDRLITLQASVDSLREDYKEFKGKLTVQVSLLAVGCSLLGGVLGTLINLGGS